MSLKELFEGIQKRGVTPIDAKVLLVGMASSESYLNACTNMNEQELTTILYSLYSENELFRVAVDALRLMIEDELKRDKPVVGTPVNTHSVDLKAQKAIDDAMAELGAICVKNSSNKTS